MGTLLPGSGGGVEEGELLHAAGEQGLLRRDEMAQQALRCETQTLRHPAAGGEEELGPLHDDPQLLEVLRPQGTHPAGREDAPGGDHAYPGDP